jgi:hypothetical protein
VSYRDDPPVRRVKCPTCGARRYNRCISGGVPVSWCHVERHSISDAPDRHRPRKALPRELNQWLAEGVPMTEIAERCGLTRSSLWRRGIRRR